MKSGIYKITNKINSKVYIGSAVSLLDRWEGHRRKLNKNRHGNCHLQSAWNKYGSTAFIFQIILYCAKEYLLQWEQIAIDGHKTLVGWDQMYNFSPTAGSTLGYIHTDESKLKHRQVKIGTKHTPWARAKMSLATKGKKKPPRSAAHSAAISAARLGSEASIETRLKMSRSAVGKPKSQTHRDNIKASWIIRKQKADLKKQ